MRVVDDGKIREAAERLVAAASSPARVILFGSRARGQAAAESDIDFLVIERTVDSRVDEAARLRLALRGIGLPVDVLVYTEAQVEEWGEVENTALHEALREGRVVAEA